jgi:hypothetical protein
MSQKIRPVAPPVKRLHKQPRSQLKSYALDVAREIRPLDELISLQPQDIKLNQNPAILGSYLFKLWQERTDKTKDTLEIDNLSELSSFMNNSNYETKLYLLALGSIPRQLFYSNEDRELCLTTVLLFDITFTYSEDVKAKYNGGDLETYGTETLSFIKNEPVNKILVKPNKYWVKALEKQPKGKYHGLDLGSVLMTNDTLRELQDCSTMAFKLFNYTASNKPLQKIREANLFKHLGLEEQVKKQGKPRVRKAIASALKELVDLGHIVEYSHNNGLYSFTYSDKFVKHSDFLKE